MSIKAVLFDMDGTLVDSEKVYFAAWGTASSALGIDLPKEQIFKFMGRTKQENHTLITELLDGDAARADELLTFHEQEFLRLADIELELKPGAREALAALHDMGLPLALATSTHRYLTEPRMALFDLKKEFETVICGDEIENGKPAPDIFLNAAANLNVDPTECVVVEDSFNGVRAAHAAGSYVVMIPDLHQPTPEIEELCDAVLPSLFELPAFIEDVNSRS